VDLAQIVSGMSAPRRVGCRARRDASQTCRAGKGDGVPHSEAVGGWRRAWRRRALRYSAPWRVYVGFRDGHRKAA